MDAFGDEHFARAAGDAERHQHRFGDGGAALVEAGVGDVHARELGHHRLVFVDDLQRSLARLGLVRGVGGVEFRPRGDGIDDARDEVVVGSAAEEADGVRRRGVLVRERPHVTRQLDLGERRRNVEHPREAQVRRDVREEVFDAADADAREHRGDIFGGVENVFGHFGNQCGVRNAAFGMEIG